MALTLDFHPDAEIELDEAIEWYEAKSPGLGLRFFEEYKVLKGFILANPQQFSIELGEVRKATFKKFPYVLLYFVWEELVYIIAVFHASQGPEKWQKRAKGFQM